MMNLPLLFWASAETGEDRYREIAAAHAETAASTLIRENGATYHAFRYDVDTGEAIGASTLQGHSGESCWSRGQAWAIYGFALAYRYTGDTTFLETARHVAAYYVDNLPADLVPDDVVASTEESHDRLGPE
jgi:unsaturated chondroitin disaccharide hydrolase